MRKTVATVVEVEDVDNQQHFLGNGKCRDRKAWRASCRIDCRRDAMWFLDHPGVAERSGCDTSRNEK